MDNDGGDDTTSAEIKMMKKMMEEYKRQVEEDAKSGGSQKNFVKVPIRPKSFNTDFPEKEATNLMLLKIKQNKNTRSQKKLSSSLSNQHSSQPLHSSISGFLSEAGGYDSSMTLFDRDSYTNDQNNTITDGGGGGGCGTTSLENMNDTYDHTKLNVDASANVTFRDDNTTSTKNRRDLIDFEQLSENDKDHPPNVIPINDMPPELLNSSDNFQVSRRAQSELVQ